MDNSIGIYIHIPFCKSKCNYCDFNSYSGREYLAGPYFDALFSEMKLRSDELRGRRVKTIFIGGGTPSLVDPKYISAILELCSKLFELDPEAEISMESNPGTLSYDSLKAYRSAGVNRLSIGLQAWQDRLLKELGRIHDRQQFVDNYEAAVKAGFHNINIDLIFGLPGQTMEEWVETLEAVTSLGESTAPRTGSNATFPDSDAAYPGSDAGYPGSDAAYLVSALTHLSCYSLKIEEGTNFGDRLEAGTILAADDELDRRMYCYTIEFLGQKGFKHYEISNFARPGFECSHNLVYWKAREYAGFGAGAHSYLDNNRFSNVVGVEEYIEAVKQMEANALEEQNLYTDIQFINRQNSMAEFMILGLRLVGGIRTEEFEDRYGVNLQTAYGEKLLKLVKKGLLVNDCGCFKLTPLGLDLANQVFIEFI